MINKTGDFVTHDCGAKPFGEYRTHQDINLFEIANEYAKLLQEHVDELAFDMAVETLARYGYVKVVRCRDCRYYTHSSWRCDLHGIVNEVEPDCFCAWGKRRQS